MKVYTRVVWDIETGKIVECESYDYAGPVALCDRAAQAQAKNAFGQDTAAAQQYGAEVGAVQPGLVSQLQSMASNPQGYGHGALNVMQNEAQEAAGATADKTNEALSLQAMRSGNAAGLGAGEVAATEGASRGQLTTIQNILAQNAMLKAQQQEGALQGLGGILGQNISGRANALGQENASTAALTNAGKSGWFQNMTGLMSALKPGASVGPTGVTGSIGKG